MLKNLEQVNKENQVLKDRINNMKDQQSSLNQKHKEYVTASETELENVLKQK